MSFRTPVKYLKHIKLMGSVIQVADYAWCASSEERRPSHVFVGSTRARSSRVRMPMFRSQRDLTQPRLYYVSIKRILME